MASKSTLTLIFLISNLLSLAANCNAYTYMWLVQNWPPSVCSSSSVTGSCRQYLDYFTINGFWPEYSQGPSYPSYCSNSPFDPSQIETIRSELEVYWPKVYGGENEEAWKHAWEKHGTCSEKKFNQKEYFGTALKLRTTHKYDVYSMLKSAGIKPREEMPYLKSEIALAVYQKIGKLPGIRCNNNKETGKPQLSGMVLCFEHDGVTPIDCPNFANHKCPPILYWPEALVTSPFDMVSNQ